VHYLHTMVRVADLDAALAFYGEALGLTQVRRVDNEGGRFTLVFLAAPDDATRLTGDFTITGAGVPMVELTYNWDPEDYGGGRMAFVRSPDNISVELLQKGPPLAPAEPWASMPNVGVW